MRLFNNLFKRKSKKIDEKTLNSMGIKTAKVDRIEVKEPNYYSKKWRILYNDTDEVVEIDPNNEKDMDEFWDSGRPMTILRFVD